MMQQIQRCLSSYWMMPKWPKLPLKIPHISSHQPHRAASLLFVSISNTVSGWNAGFVPVRSLPGKIISKITYMSHGWQTILPYFNYFYQNYYYYMGFLAGVCAVYLHYRKAMDNWVSGLSLPRKCARVQHSPSAAVEEDDAVDNFSSMH